MSVSDCQRGQRGEKAEGEGVKRAAPSAKRGRVPPAKLTLPDVVPGPLVVLEEGVPLDLVHAVASQSHLSEETPQPAHSRQYPSLGLGKQSTLCTFKGNRSGVTF